MSHINAETRLLGLFGFPLQHSFSPLMHNAVLSTLEMNFAYLPLKVRPGKLRDAVAGFRAMNFVGANVTIPHKEEIMAFLDQLTPEAEWVGAVNTLYWNAEKQLMGDNTDVEGFRRSLSTLDMDLEGRSVAIIGSGGAARAVAVALARLKVKEIVILARRMEMIQRLIHDLEPRFPEVLWSPHSQATSIFNRELERVWLLVNASPVGMYPHVNEAPVSRTQLSMLPQGAHVYDLVYNPPETALLKQARALGYHAHEGLDMLVYQGAAAFERWTGVFPPIQRMRDTVLKEIAPEPHNSDNSDNSDHSDG